MAKEIERKFLVNKEILIPLLTSGSYERRVLRQYYLHSEKNVAVRLRQDGDDVILAIKAGGDGMTTNEFEFTVDPSSYVERSDERVGIEINKTRHLVPHAGRIFEVDVYADELEGLIVAELECPDTATVTDLPEWIGDEVTYDSRYKNAVLAVKGMPSPDMASEGIYSGRR